MRRFLLILPVLLVVVLTGCTNDFGYINARWITEVSLVYNPLDYEKTAAPFDSKSFKDTVFIKDLADAMNRSARIPGDLDYDADFRMKLTYGDGYTEDYIMALGGASGNPGLLLSAEKSSTGYTIPVKYADRLRAVIFDGGKQTVSASAPEQAGIIVDSPFTISRNPLFQLTGLRGYLNLELIRGTYREDWNTSSPLAGRSWSGDFRLSLTGEDGRLLHTFPLSEQYNEELVFNDLFQIEFGYYNSDGNPDFTIGQYGSSNGNFFRIFTVNKDYSIKELRVEQTPELFISSSERYSVKMDETTEGFTASHYDNSLGRQVVSTYRWDGAVFQKIK